MNRSVAFLFTVLVGASLALGQESPPAGVLSGPVVPAEVARTIVRRDTRGNFQRVEGRPELAAAELLDLEPDVRSRVRGIPADRAARLASQMIDRLDTVMHIAELNESGKRDEATEHVQAIWTEFDGESASRPLATAVESELTVSQRDEYGRILNEYWSAWIDWELRNSKDNSDRARQRVEQRLAFSLFQSEVRDVYDRVLKPYRDRVDTLIRALDPTPEQRAAIRELVLDHLRSTKGRSTSAQRREVLSRIYALLDDDRKAKLFDLVAKQASGE